MTVDRTPPHDERKRTVFFDLEEVDELHDEAERQQRSISWLIQAAWLIARAELRAMSESPVKVRRSRARLPPPRSAPRKRTSKPSPPPKPPAQDATEPAWVANDLDPMHGTLHGYNHGCRRPCCRDAMAAYRRGEYERSWWRDLLGLHISDLTHEGIAKAFECRVRALVQANEAALAELRERDAPPSIASEVGFDKTTEVRT